MNRTITNIVATVTLGACVNLAQAAPFTPTYDFFEDLPQATFGGTGIPTNPTAFTIFDGFNGDVVTIALSATQRFANPPLTNDGAGTYTAGAGENDGTPGNPGNRSTWNFNWFINVVGQGNIGQYGIKLFYDLDPAANTDQTAMGMFDFAGFPGQLSEGSENATFGYLGGVPAFPGVTPPTFTAFDPNVGGEYSFAIVANPTGAAELGRVAINVNVTAVPLPATLALLGLGLLGVGWTRRKH